MKLKKTNEQILSEGATGKDKTERRANRLALKFTGILLKVFRVSPKARLELAYDWAFAANHLIAQIKSEHPELFVDGHRSNEKRIGGIE